MELRHAAQSLFRAQLRVSRSFAPIRTQCYQTRPAPLSTPKTSLCRPLSSTSAAFAPSPDSSPKPPNASRQRTSTLPPRPPVVKSPWTTTRTPSPPVIASAPKATTGADSPPAENAPLVEHIKWDVDNFILRHQMGMGPPPRVRLRPRTGRTVFTSGSVDVARSFQLLNRLVRENDLKRTVQRQRFHERPGLKRKRLRMERWRVRFKNGFQACCRRALTLNKQGW